MGCDAENTFPVGTKSRAVREFLELLGYRYWGTERSRIAMHHAGENPFEYFTGVSAFIAVRASSATSVHTRTAVWRNRVDSILHNRTVRQLHLRFGGSFSSDEGRNRYLRFDGDGRTGADAGCFLALWRFETNFARVGVHRQSRTVARHPSAHLAGDHDPEVVANNLLVPYLVAVAEDYFRTAWIALLHYSPRRADILHSYRVTADEFASVDRSWDVSELVARRRTFQNVAAIDRNFRDIDAKLDVGGMLKRPFRRRKMSLYHSLHDLFERRHALVHRAELALPFDDRRLAADVENVKHAVTRVHLGLQRHYGWEVGEW